MQRMNRIKEAREALKVSQIELANRAGFSQPYIHDLENNHRGAKPETLQRIANALGVKVSDLVIERKAR